MKCKTKYCRNPRGIKKVLCNKCHQREWRKNNPKKSAYRSLKDRAIKRKLEFDISFDYFCGLADGFGYFDRNCENVGDVATIDRVDASKGYVKGNLQVIKLSENVVKGNKERHLPEYVQALLERKRLQELDTPPTEEDLNPF